MILEFYGIFQVKLTSQHWHVLLSQWGHNTELQQIITLLYYLKIKIHTGKELAINCVIFLGLDKHKVLKFMHFIRV
jgi:hypothetical protein